MTKGASKPKVFCPGSRQPGVLLQRGGEPCAGRVLCRCHRRGSVPGASLRDHDDVEDDGSDGDDDGDDDVDDKDL